jgi:hypothetical protein
MKCSECGDTSKSIFDWELNKGRLECPACKAFNRITVKLNGEEKSFGRVVSAKKYVVDKLEGAENAVIGGGFVELDENDRLTSNVRLAYLIDNYKG